MEHECRKSGPEWKAPARMLRSKAAEFVLQPTVSKQGTDEEQGKMMLVDPSGNLIELKGYRNVAAALKLGNTEPCAATAA